MLSQIEAIRENRAVLLEQLEGLTTEQLNQIVKGFNNNFLRFHEGLHSGVIAALCRRTTVGKSDLPL
jgi:hypothetical protein